jgi:peptide/nickel transport system permease protein
MSVPLAGRPEMRALSSDPGRLTWASRIGIGVAVLMMVLALFGELVAPYGGDEIISGARLEPPSASHLFGTDENGMDIFSRVLIAPRYDVLIGVSGTLVAVALGVTVGVLSGYVGRAATWLIRITDVLQAFPVFILAMAVVVFAGQNIRNIILVVGIVNAPLYARISHAQANRLRDAEFARSAIVSGLRPSQVLVHHVLPNCLNPVVAQLSVTVGFTILLTAGLSFVGAGIRVPTPEWGSMIALGTSNLVTGEWWPTLFPGLALAAAIFGFSSVGDWLRQRLGVTAL